MTDEKKRITDTDQYRRILKRKQRGRFLSLTIAVLFIVLVTMLLLLRILSQMHPQPRRMYLKEDVVANEVKTRALIVRDEQAYAAASDGLFRNFIPQGTRVGKNQTIGYIVPKNQEEQLRKLQKVELEALSRRYELLSSSRTATAARVFAETGGRIDRTINLLLRHKMDGRADLNREYESTLNILLEQRSQDLYDFSFNDETLNRLEEYRKSMEQSLGAGLAKITADHAGILIRSADGLEPILNSQTVMSLSADDLSRYLKDDSGKRAPMVEEAKKDQPLFKITQSINQYFVCFAPTGLQSKLAVGTGITLRSPDNGVEIKNTIVVRSEENKQGTLLVLQCNSELEKFSDLRTTNVVLLVNEHKGLRVPRSALLKFKPGNPKADVFVVYNNFIRRSPVKVSEYNADYALIEAQPNAQYPIRPYSIIITNPNDVKEDQPYGDH